MSPSPVAVLRAIAYPLTESRVLVALVFFWLLVSFASWGGLLGLFLMFLILPALIRYQMILLAARARGVTPEVPGIEFFNWFGRAWTLFPVLVVVFLGWATIVAAEGFGIAGMLVMLAVAGIFFPASIAVLAITHSPLQSLNPVALARFLVRTRATYWIAVLVLVVFSWLSISAEALPMMLAVLVQLLLSFSFFSLAGSLIEPYGLIEDIELPAAMQQDASTAMEVLEKKRANVLSHAYGFISRGNRDGGLRHVLAWIQEDPDPAAGRAWFLERMLAWDDPQAALVFAQHCIRDHLEYGEPVPAVKLIMRCRLIDERFRPFPGDVQAAIAACDVADNHALAASLRHY